MVLHMWQVKWLQCKWTQPRSSVDKNTESICIINVRSIHVHYVWCSDSFRLGYTRVAVVWISNFGIKFLPPPLLVLGDGMCTATGDKPTRLFSKMLWTIIVALENLRTGEGQTSNTSKWPRHTFMFISKLPIPMTEDWCFYYVENHTQHQFGIAETERCLCPLSEKDLRVKSGENGLDLNKFNIMNNQCKIR